MSRNNHHANGKSLFSPFTRALLIFRVKEVNLSSEKHTNKKKQSIHRGGTVQHRHKYTT